MNWQMLQYFLRKVVARGDDELNEFMKIYEYTEKMVAKEQAATKERNAA